jgi:hypothetical protein
MDADHLTIISASLQRLFENSKYLDDNSFIAFSSALCRMSSEVTGTPFSESSESLSTSKSSRTVSTIYASLVSPKKKWQQLTSGFF